MASKDPIIQGFLDARAFTIQTGTPLYVWRDGRVVNLNPRWRVKKTRSSRPTR